jgi:hypothetical protein
LLIALSAPVVYLLQVRPGRQALAAEPAPD